MERLYKKYYSANATILSPEALEKIRNSLPSDQNSDDNQKSSHNFSFFSGSSIQMQTDKKKSKFKSVRISDNKDLSKSLLPIILQDSEDALEVFKKAQNEMEKAVAKDCALEQKLKNLTLASFISLTKIIIPIRNRNKEMI
ncbi:2303_t:CDS:2, partial [Funneliformis geosporum]